MVNSKPPPPHFQTSSFKFIFTFYQILHEGEKSPVLSSARSKRGLCLAAKRHDQGIRILPNFKPKKLDLRLWRFFVEYVLLSQIPWRRFNQGRYPAQSAVPQLCPFKGRSVTLAACSGMRFYPTSNQNDSIWGCGVFLLNTFYCHKYLEEGSTNAGTRANPPYLSYARSRGGPWRWPHVRRIAILPNFKPKLLDLRVLGFFVKYVLLSQIPWRRFNQSGYPGQSAVPQLCPFKERSVTLAACSGNSDFI